PHRIRADPVRLKNRWSNRNSTHRQPPIQIVCLTTRPHRLKSCVLWPTRQTGTPTWLPPLITLGADGASFLFGGLSRSVAPVATDPAARVPGNIRGPHTA